MQLGSWEGLSQCPAGQPPVPRPLTPPGSPPPAGGVGRRLSPRRAPPWALPGARVHPAALWWTQPPPLSPPSAEPLPRVAGRGGGSGRPRGPSSMLPPQVPAARLGVLRFSPATAWGHRSPPRHGDHPPRGQVCTRSAGGLCTQPLRPLPAAPGRAARGPGRRLLGATTRLCAPGGLEPTSPAPGRSSSCGYGGAPPWGSAELSAPRPSPPAPGRKPSVAAPQAPPRPGPRAPASSSLLLASALPAPGTTDPTLLLLLPPDPGEASAGPRGRLWGAPAEFGGLWPSHGHRALAGEGRLGRDRVPGWRGPGSAPAALREPPSATRSSGRSCRGVRTSPPHARCHGTSNPTRGRARAGLTDDRQ